MPESSAGFFDRLRAVLASTLEDEAKVLLIYILDRQGPPDGWAWPSKETILRDLKWSESKVYRWARWCQHTARVLRVRPRAGTSSEYQVVDPLTWSKLGLAGGATCDTPRDARSDAPADVTPVITDRAGVSSVTTHKDERLRERPSVSSPPVAVSLEGEGKASCGSEKRARRRRRRRRRKTAGAPPAGGKSADPLAERLRAWEASYRAAMGFAYPQMPDHDVPAMQALLGRYAPREIDAAVAMMHAPDSWYRRKRGGGTVEMLREHFGELLAKARAAGMLDEAMAPPGGAAPAASPPAISIEDAILRTVNGITRRLRRPLSQSESTRLLELARLHVPAAWERGGEPLAREWARTLCHFVVDCVATQWADPLGSAARKMDNWRQSQMAG